MNLKVFIVIIGGIEGILERIWIKMPHISLIPRQGSKILNLFRSLLNNFIREENGKCEFILKSP
jgi:hypothetical protein